MIMAESEKQKLFCHLIVYCLITLHSMNGLPIFLFQSGQLLLLSLNPWTFQGNVTHDCLHGVTIKINSNPCLHEFSAGLKIQLPHTDHINNCHIELSCWPERIALWD